MSKISTLVMATAVVALSTSAMAASLGPIKDSSEFAFKYEGDVLPNNAGLGFTLIDPNNRMAGEVKPATLHVAGGVDFLRIDTDTDSTPNDMFSYQIVGGPGTNWDPHFLGGWTIEIRTIVRPNNSGSFGAGIGARDENSSGLTMLFHDKVVGDTGASVATALNNDTWHVFRIASYSPDNNSTGQIYQVWRDGIEIAQFAQNSEYLTPTLAIGDFVASFAEVNFDIDYLRWDTSGAFAPAPIPEPAAGLMVAGLAAVAVRRRKRA